ncbi:MAG: ATP-binding protein [Pirellulales bacterium]
MASLFVIQGRDQGTRFQLEDDIITVGRTQNNAVRLHDTEVSRVHAELIRRDNIYLLRDLNSSNGTFVNGQQLQTGHPVENGPVEVSPVEVGEKAEHSHLANGTAGLHGSHDKENSVHDKAKEGVDQAVAAPVAGERELVSGDQLQLGKSLLLYTGFVEDSLDNVADQINIVPKLATDENSRIVASLSHSHGSEWFLADANDSSSPWLARARSNLQIMYRTALAVSHTMDIDQLLARIMDMIFEWVDADRGCIMLKDAQSGRLVPKVRRHRRGVRSEETITLSKTILDYVVERNEGVLTSDAREDDRWDPANSIVKLGVREAICVPMQGRYHVVGVIYIDTSVTPQRMLQGQLAGASGKGNQFTEEHLKLMIAIAHQAALAVEDTSYYQALVQAERLAAVGQTIASLSHHIKNILQGVRGGSYLIELGLGDHALSGDKADASSDARTSNGEAARNKAVETIRKGWDIVERNQDRISSLVMDMLTYSKEREPVREPADLNEVTAEVVGLMQPRAKDLEVDLQWHPASTMPMLTFDPEALHRAILNVVTNAIDACRQLDSKDGADSKNGESKNWVRISTNHEDGADHVQVIVEDNGQGIDPEELENIFAVFVSHKGGCGTGLGLPVSRKIMEEHGGQIHLTSKLGEGSKFILELPAR